MIFWIFKTVSSSFIQKNFEKRRSRHYNSSLLIPHSLLYAPQLSRNFSLAILPSLMYNTEMNLNHSSKNTP